MHHINVSSATKSHVYNTWDSLSDPGPIIVNPCTANSLTDALETGQLARFGNSLTTAFQRFPRVSTFFGQNLVLARCSLYLSPSGNLFCQEH